RLAALCRAAATLPPRGAGPRPGAAAGKGPCAHRDLFRSLALLVCAVRGNPRRPRRLSIARDHAPADADVPFLALAECVAAADPRPEPLVHEPGHGTRPRSRRR